MEYKTGIPKIIHQIWLGNEKPPYRLMETWEAMHPDWEYKLWTDENIKDVIELLPQYHEIEEYCGKADILRYQILHKFGGVFIDADSQCLRRLDDFFLENNSFAAFENEEVRKGLIANGYLGATKDNELMKILIDKISKIKNINAQPPWKITGPRLLTKTVVSLTYDGLAIYPSHFFMPVHYTGLKYKGDGLVYANQFWGSTFGYETIRKERNIMNDFFDKIYCINLDKRVDRWEKVKTRFDEVGINVERFSAIETRQGWDGCKASHLKIIENAKNNNYNSIFIFEDDIVFTDDFIKKINEIIDELKKTKWDLLYLSGNQNNAKDIKPISDNLSQIDSMLGTGSYGINSSIYDDILNRAPMMKAVPGYKRGRAIDVFYNEDIVKNKIALVTNPMICYQENGFSDIEGCFMVNNDIQE